MRSAIAVCCVAALMGVSGVASGEDAEAKKVIAVGAVAPDFELPKPDAEEGSKDTIKLSDLKGKQNVLLAFYPKAFTGGCTKQLCGYRDDISKFQSKDTLIVAVSTDQQADSDRFKKEYKMPFVVLGDPKAEVVGKYGIPLAEYAGNKIAQRSVVLIDKNGVVQYVDDNYQIGTDEKPLYEALAKLGGEAPKEGETEKKP